MINFPRYEHQSSKRNKWKWESIVEKLMLGKRCLKMRSPSLTLLRLTGSSTGIVNNKNGSRWLWIVQDNSLINCPRQFTQNYQKVSSRWLWIVEDKSIQITILRFVQTDRIGSCCSSWGGTLLLWSQSHPFLFDILTWFYVNVLESRELFEIIRLGTPQTPSALPFSWALLRGSFWAWHVLLTRFFEGLLWAGRIITKASLCTSRHARKSLVQLGGTENLQRLHWRGFGKSWSRTNQCHNPWLQNSGSEVFSFSLVV